MFTTYLMTLNKISSPISKFYLVTNMIQRRELSMKEIDFSVIIVTYNNIEIVKDCLKSIHQYNDIGKLLEIIIVDNSSNKKILNYVKKNWRDVKIIDNNNMGFGEGNNVGAKKAKGKYLLFLNPDTILVEPIFKFAIEKFENNDNLGLFGVKLIDRNFKKNMSYYLIDKSGFLAAQLNKICNKFNFFLDGLMFISGANIFIKKEIFVNAKMFDQKIFMYKEESDLIKRVKNLNYKTAYFKSKKIIHLEGETVSNSNMALKRRLDSSRYYSKKYNLNFKKQLCQEMRYNYLKFYLYKFIKNKKQYIYKDNINIIREYL